MKQLQSENCKIFNLGIFIITYYRYLFNLFLLSQLVRFVSSLFPFFISSPSLSPTPKPLGWDYFVPFPTLLHRNTLKRQICLMTVTQISFLSMQAVKRQQPRWCLLGKEQVCVRYRNRFSSFALPCLVCDVCVCF